MYLVGQTKTKQLIDGGKLDNTAFIIIRGPKNFGKTYLTKYIANHYKMDYLLLDNKVDTIRELVSSSNKNNNCLYHFKDFDKSSPAAKAALLKIAEETPRGVKIVVTTSAYNFLDTLLSRAYIIDIMPYPMEEIMEYSKNLNIEEDFVKRLGEAYINLTPTLLFKLKDTNDVVEILDLVDETINCLNNGLSLEDISKISAKFWKDDKDRVILYLSTLSRCYYRLQGTTTKRWKIASLVQQTMAILNKVTINNYRNLIHNMLMEMV